MREDRSLQSATVPNDKRGMWRVDGLIFGSYDVTSTTHVVNHSQRGGNFGPFQ